MTTITVPMPRSHGNVMPFAPRGRENEHTTLEEVLQWLKIFIAPSQVTHLLAVDLERPGFDLLIRKGGFFDFDHLHEMVELAMELSGKCRGVYFTFNPLNHDVLSCCYNRLKTLRKGEGASDNDVVGRRWLMIDIDSRRRSGISATDVEKNLARVVALAVREFLAENGFPPPVFADSGNGYHLMYPVDLPTHDQLPKNVLKSLDAKFSNDKVEIDMSVADPSRLTRLYGTLACKGDATTTRPHRPSRILEFPDVLEVTDVLALGRIAQAVPAHTTSTIVPTPQDSVPQDVLSRARAYLATMPPSVAGDHGDDCLFEAACRLVLGFDIPPGDAIPLLREYNQRAQPPWEEERLQYKLEQADNHNDVQGRGYLLFAPGTNRTNSGVDRDSIVATLPRLEGPVFPGSVNDLVPAPYLWSLKYLSDDDITPPTGRPAFDYRNYEWWQVFQAVFQRNRAPVVIPDTYFAAGVHGANPPKRWHERVVVQGTRLLTSESARRRLRQCRRQLEDVVPELESALSHDPGGGSDHSESLATQTYTLLEQKKQLERRIGSSDCPSQCPLHGSNQTHRHYLLRPNGTHFGASYMALASQEEDGALVFDFNAKDERGRSRLDQLIRSQELYWTYLPVQMFGQACGLSHRQIRVIQGLMRERTRHKNGPRSRPGVDRIEYVERGVVRGMRGKGNLNCPLLDSKRRYVAFCGNLRLNRGRGYRLIGELSSDWTKLGGWLRRFGYPASTVMTEDEIWSWVSTALNDLAHLGELFSLTVTGLGKDGVWHGIDEMVIQARSARGRRWLSHCSMRVYAPDDYLISWRHWFASQLGFSYIAGGDWSQPPVATPISNVDEIRLTPEAIKTWLRKSGLTQSQLANMLGWSTSRVSRQLTGATKMTDEFQSKLRELIGLS